MKTHKVIFWVATAIIILWEGIMPLSTLLFAPSQTTIGTRPLGYPDYFAYALIICKALGVLAISLSGIALKLKEWAYAGLTFNLIFAAISHACVDRNIGYILMPLAVLGVLAISYIYAQKIRNATHHH